MAKNTMTPALPADKRSGELLAEALELEAEALMRRAAAARAQDLEAQRARMHAMPPHEDPGLLTLAQLAKRLNVSEAHVRRLDPPSVIVGDKKTKRYDLDAVRRWLATREPKATTPIKKRSAMVLADDIDVSSVLTNAGLRRSGS